MKEEKLKSAAQHEREQLTASLKRYLRIFRRTAATANFERRFTPRKTAPIAAKLWQRAFQTIGKFRFFDAQNIFSDLFLSFSLFSADFRGARLFLTSKSSSSRFFALDGQIFRSVRRLGLIFRFFTVRTSTCGEICAPPKSALVANPAIFWVSAGTHRKCP